MTLILDLPPELENHLQKAAAQSGQDLETFAAVALAEASARADNLAGEPQRPSLEEFEEAMDELSAGSELHPRLTAEDFSRAGIYRDHD